MSEPVPYQGGWAQQVTGDPAPPVAGWVEVTDLSGLGAEPPDAGDEQRRPHESDQGRQQHGDPSGQGG